MSDPAIEAVRRMSTAAPDEPISFNEAGRLIAAAREALKPIREKWEELYAASEDGDSDSEGNWDGGMLHVLDLLAPLIFPSEELKP
ncbi:hypothetical protein BKG82_23080 [Mycobacteroides chelonae]|uniref:Uncharacterized protein n=1 Tax=Mycobacteroides chelonae TaxID=1774 RepID=A0A1S1LJG4_MYCCH|nr:hypothetical protein [Mycobacteroides chelonae]OHU51483.1 hypothetical protein BKG82_23080 [Mycobacteroides chelonae]